MKHCMTVWTDRLQIRNRINNILPAHQGYFNLMMDMNKTLTNNSVPTLKIKPTNKAQAPIMLNALNPCSCIPLVYVHKYLFGMPFHERFLRINLVRI